MSDRRPALSSTMSRRALGAGAAGLTAMLAAAPFAHAAPAPTPSDTASSAPAAPGSATASGSATTSGSAATSGSASSSPSTTVHAQSHAGAQVKAAPQSSSGAPAPYYGFQKYRVGVQQKDGSYWPPGVTSANANLHIVETDSSGAMVSTSDCYTELSSAAQGSTATFCNGDQSLSRSPAKVMKRAERVYAAKHGEAALRKALPLLTTGPTPNGEGAGETFTAEPGDTVTITQTDVGDANLQPDSSTAILKPCTVPTDSVPVCFSGDGIQSTDEVFDDAGPLPVAVDDSRSTDQGKSVDVVVTANDGTKGATVTGLAVGLDPKHGTATVLSGRSDPVGPTPSPSPIAPTASAAIGAASQRYGNRAAQVRAAAAPTVGTTIRYTPKAGFSGTDTFTYRLSTVNGSADAKVTIRVAAAPSSSASSTSAASPSATSSKATNSDLASTGSDTQALGEIALGLLAAGGIAAAAGRRRLAGRSGHHR